SLESGAIDATVLDGLFSRKAKARGLAVLADFSQANLPMMNHLVALRRSYLKSQPEVVENLLRALIEGLAFTWSPARKPAVLKSVMRRLRIADTELAEEGYQDLLGSGALEKKPYPSLEAMRNVQRLLANANPKIAAVKLEELVDRSIVRRRDESGFIDRLYRVYPPR